MNTKKQYEQPNIKVANVQTPLLSDQSTTIDIGGPIGGGDHSIPSGAKESSFQWGTEE